MARKIVLEYGGVVITITSEGVTDSVVKDYSLEAYRRAVLVVRRDFERAVGAAKLARGIVADEPPLTTDALFHKLEEECRDGIKDGRVTVSRAREKG